MQSTQASSSEEEEVKKLTKGLTTIQAFHDAEDGVKPNQLVTVVGIVKDYRTPMPTSGSDYKAAMTICDLSGGDLVINIFRSKEKMPPDLNGGDIVCIANGKVQRFRSDCLSLITTFKTEIHVFNRDTIPKFPAAAEPAPKTPATKTLATKAHGLSMETCKYVSFLNDSAVKDHIPDDEEFQRKKTTSQNVKTKFCELKDVRVEDGQKGKFVDLVVEVVKDPWNTYGHTTLYVTDYTANELFYCFERSSGANIHGDVHGYTAELEDDAQSKRWQGPRGKRTLQITCFDKNSEHVSKFEAGDWVLLRNVRIKHAHNGTLEGQLHGDERRPNARFVSLLRPKGESVDPRLKNALHRKREYLQTELQTKQELPKPLQALSSSDTNSRKRCAQVDEGGAESPVQAKKTKKNHNSKTRRKFKRRGLQKEGTEGIVQGPVSCEHHDKPITTVSRMLAPVYVSCEVGDKHTVKLALPFNNASYRAVVRVVDFEPRQLEDFAIFRQGSEHDCLDDDDGDSEDAGWQWSFFLQLEDASNEGRENRDDKIWVRVGNREGQLLTDRDASDLKKNTQDLVNLRHLLSCLWGNLEECKREKEKSKYLPSSVPPPCSPESGMEHEEASSLVLSGNGPFACCIRQYGIQGNGSTTRGTPSNGNGDGSDGSEWERVYGLFGTKLSTELSASDGEGGQE